MNKIRILPTFLAALGMFVLTIYTYYPGVVSADTINQLLQAQTFDFNDWHPPVMSFVWAMLNHIYFGPASMLVFHNLMFWSALLLLALKIFPNSNWHRILFIIIFGLFPAVFSQLGLIFKDVSMSTSLFLAAVLLFYAKDKAYFLIGALVFLFYGFAARLNSAPGVIILCIWFAEIAFKTKLFKSCLYGALLFILIFAGNYLFTEKVLHARHYYPFQQVELHDLAAISLAKNQLIFPEYVLHWPELSMARLHKFYTPANVGYLLFDNIVVPLSVDRDENRALTKTWITAIVANPGIYLKHRANCLKYSLRSCLSKKNDFCRKVSAALGISYRPSLFYEMYCKVTMHGPLQMFFHAWLYVINCFGVIILAAIYRRRFVYWREIIYISSSGLLYFLPGFLYVPACEFRYAYWTVFASLLAVVLLVRSIMSDNTRF